MKSRFRSISVRLHSGHVQRFITALPSTVRMKSGSRHFNPTVVKQRDRVFFHAPVKRQGGLSRYLKTTYGFLPARWSLSFCPPRDGGLYSSLTPSILSSTKLILATTVGTALDVGKWHSGCPGYNRPRGCRGSWRTLVLSHNGNTTAWNEGSSDQHFDCSWELPIKFTDPNTRSPRRLVE